MTEEVETWDCEPDTQPLLYLFPTHSQAGGNILRKSVLGRILQTKFLNRNFFRSFYETSIFNFFYFLIAYFFLNFRQDIQPWSQEEVTITSSECEPVSEAVCEVRGEYFATNWEEKRLNTPFILSKSLYFKISTLGARWGWSGGATRWSGRSASSSSSPRAGEQQPVRILYTCTLHCLLLQADAIQDTASKVRAPSPMHQLRLELLFFV